MPSLKEDVLSLRGDMPLMSACAPSASGQGPSQPFSPSHRWSCRRPRITLVGLLGRAAAPVSPAFSSWGGCTMVVPREPRLSPEVLPLTIELQFLAAGTPSCASFQSWLKDRHDRPASPSPWTALATSCSWCPTSPSTRVGMVSVSRRRRRRKWVFMISCWLSPSMSFGSVPKGFSSSTAMRFRVQRVKTWMKEKTTPHQSSLTQGATTRGTASQCMSRMQSHVCA
mmetsp:Transcript_23908/g.67179  ORF Transcript_23908/g.67179 Transcript_23908/m.67179 type:complete len:226 (-) Transcript_23908:843-1520(-)